MLDLFTPTDHPGAYQWAAVLLAHFAIGGGAWVILARFSAWYPAVWISALYGVVWELGVQHLGAGMSDAVVDWAAVTLGACMASALWRRSSLSASLTVAIIAILSMIGITRRWSK